MVDTAQEDILLTDVTKIFRLGIWKTKPGVLDLTLSVPRGKVVGLLGPNGSGKSTTIKMILGFLKPTKGEILVCGHPADKRMARNFIGYLPENPRFQKFLTANDILRYYGHLLNLSGSELEHRCDELLTLVNLSHAKQERVQGFSKGMTQRLAIAQALLNRPKLLIFDEPMSGLDPIGRREIRKLIRQIHDEMPNTTIFFSTHILNDIEELCTLVAVMRKGKLNSFCSIDDLLTSDLDLFDIVVQNAPDQLRTRLTRENFGKQTPLGLSFNVEGVDLLMTYLTDIRKAGATVISINSHRRNLEEALFTEPELLKKLQKNQPKAAGAQL